MYREIIHTITLKTMHQGLLSYVDQKVVKILLDMKPRLWLVLTRIRFISVDISIPLV
ncbi:hypothetical protein NVIRENTERO_02760 [Sodalis praecaptivus]|nr:hypothetical protein NVIRENTERO_02760 [Sodalis praecaptivus]